MVGAHVAADGLDHRVIGVTTGDVAAFAPDEPCHRSSFVAPTGGIAPAALYGQNDGVSSLSTSHTRIQLCGPLVIEFDDRRLERLLPGRQGRQLFAFLVVNRHRSVRRAELVETIWPEQLPSASDAGIDALISKLRKALGADAVEGRGSIRLRLGDASIDVETATEAVHRAESAVGFERWTEAWGPALVALFVAEREFLPEDDAPWIDDERRRLADVRLRALECYAAAGLGIGGPELNAAVRAARQLVQLAPLRERGYQLLMRSLASQGNVAEALRVYTTLCETLRDELGVTPGAASRAVHDELINA
jgi:DNA-binding SARP family transcriptional activator